MSARDLRIRDGWLVLLLALVTFLLPAESWAQKDPNRLVDFDVPAQPAATALVELGKQAGIQIVSSGQDLGGVSSRELKGRMTVGQAVERLLQGTGLTASLMGGDTVIVKRRDLPRASDVSAPPSAAAEPTQEQILVTAQKRVQRYYDVPMTIAAMTGEELRERRIENLQDLAIAVPELAVFAGNQSYRLVMRGVGDQGGTMPHVGVYLDEVAVSATVERPLDLRPLDLERVELLYGPQGTLYGQGSAGGTVRFITRNPTFDRLRLEGSLDASFTEDGSPTQKFVGIANVPAGDNLAFRVAGTYENVGGWIDAPSAGKRDINSGEFYNLRVKGLWNASQVLTLTPMFIVQRNRMASTSNGENAAGDIVLPPFAPNADLPINSEFDLYSLTATVDLGAAELVSATSHFDSKADGGYTNRFGTLNRLFTFNSKDKATNQEFRLSSRSGGPLSWTLGAFYRDADFASNVFLTAGPANVATIVNVPVISLDRSKSWSFYLDGGYQLSDRLEIGGGIRYFTDDKTNGSQTAEFHSVDPRVYATYELASRVKAFASAAKGFRSGGFNSINPNFPSTFQPEKVYSYEAGVRFSGFGSRVRGEVSAYHTDYESMQVLVVRPGIGIGFTDNVGKARIDGIDTSLHVNLGDGLTIGGSVTFTETKVTEVLPGASVVVGDRLNYIPRYSYSVYLQRHFAWAPGLPGKFRVDYNERDKSVFNLRTSNVRDESDMINMLNARIGATWRGISFDLYAQNILDDRGRLSPNILGFSARSRPRTIGVAIGANF